MPNIVLCVARDEFRRELAGILEKAGFEITGEAVDGVEAKRMVEQLNPDILILEMDAAVLGGIEVTREIAKSRPGTRVVMLSMRDDDDSVLESFQAGVKAYVLKSHVAQDIVLAISLVERGKHFLSPAITDALVESYPFQYQNHSGELTGIEADILRMLVLDKPKSDIARQLGITIESLETHRKSVMDKLHASNIGGLVRYAVRKGMLITALG